MDSSAEFAGSFWIGVVLKLWRAWLMITMLRQISSPESFFVFDSGSLRQLMTQLHNPVEPFGEVNVYRQQNGTLDVVATVLRVLDVEGASTGLALYVSALMNKLTKSHCISPTPETLSNLWRSPLRIQKDRQ
jgi:hypothetical protein